MLYIDSRVGSVELLPHLSLPHKSTARLQYGDAAFLGNGPDGPKTATVGIERKTVSDLLSSMESGRLSGHQLIGLTHYYQYVYLVLEGYWRSRARDGVLEVLRKGKWVPLTHGSRRYMAKEITNYLNTLAIMCEVRIWLTNNITQTAQWLTGLYGWWQKPWEKHAGHLQFENPLPPSAFLIKPSITHRIAKELTGVGWARGKEIARRFPSPKLLVGADEKTLAKIPGIGKVLAASIVKELRGGIY